MIFKSSRKYTSPPKRSGLKKTSHAMRIIAMPSMFLRVNVSNFDTSGCMIGGFYHDMICSFYLLARSFLTFVCECDLILSCGVEKRSAKVIVKAKRIAQE